MTHAVLAGDNNEVEFELSELFFSRTDEHGLIEFGNSVFQRVAQYSWPELLRKPHKIIRHADMPRAVFWLLWDTIKQGKPIGAYVKNRAKDGRSYWVYAIVTPVEGGYLSVRLKPSSAILSVVKSEYAALAAVETSERLAPAQSAAMLLERLGGLGFPDYATFMATALGAELISRDKGMGQRPDYAMQQFAAMRESAAAIQNQANMVAEAYARNESVPFNFRVLAAQLGQDGSAISVISSNYTQLSAEMKSILQQFISAAGAVRSAINEGAFLVGTARVQRDLLQFFANESDESALPRETETALLSRQQQAYWAKAAEGLTQIAKTVRGFQQSCLEMTRLSAGLEVTRIMGKVECARHTRVKERTDELLSDLEKFQRTITLALKDIERMNYNISAETESLLSAARAA